MTSSYLKAVCEICGNEFKRSKAEMKRSLKRSMRLTCFKCRSTTHGMSKSAEYKSWASMKSRCSNRKNTHYARYGGRGINYDPKWKDFEQFLLDMGPMPQPKMELDRVHNDGNYCKENCRWATRKEQTRNRGGARATRFYSFNGKNMCIADWAKEIGITSQSLQKRLNKGWPLELALSSEKRDKDPNKRVLKNPHTNKGKTVRRSNCKYITIDDQTKTYAEWEKEKNLSKGLISKRLKNGFSEYDAVMAPIRSKRISSES